MEKLRTSYSSLNTFASCPRKFEFDKLYPKRKRDGEWYAADTGSALHAGFQHYLTHKDLDLATWEFMKAFPFLAEFDQPNDYRNFEACLSTLEFMIESVHLDNYDLARIKKPDGTVVPAVEVPFEIVIKGAVIPPCERFPEGAQLSVIGYIDAIMQHAGTGLYRTLDIKTTRMHLADSTAKFLFDTQQVPYGIVVDHVAQGMVESFEVLYLDCYIDLLEPKVSLYPFMKTQEDIEEWVANKMIQFQQMTNFVTGDYFPRTDSGCLFYSKPCRYLEPCVSRSRPDLMEWFLGGDEEAAIPEERLFEPWIVAEINLEG